MLSKSIYQGSNPWAGAKKFIIMNIEVTKLTKNKKLQRRLQRFIPMLIEYNGQCMSFKQIRTIQSCNNTVIISCFQKLSKISKVQFFNYGDDCYVRCSMLD